MQTLFKNLFSDTTHCRIAHISKIKQILNNNVSRPFPSHFEHLFQIRMQNLSYEKEYHLHENEPLARAQFFFHLFEWFHTKTHFIIETLADSEMAFYESCGQ